MCHGEYLEIIGQLGGAGSLLPTLHGTLHGFQGPNLETWSCAAMQQMSSCLNHLADLVLYF